MESIHRLRCLLSVAVMSAFALVQLVRASDVPPVLSQQTAMNTALDLAQQATHSHSFSTLAVRFEPSTREWTVNIDALMESGTAKSFIATINESTGRACLQLPPAVGCVVQENIRQTVAAAQAKAQAEAFARAHPAPDLQHLAEALLRYQYGPRQPAENRARSSRYFVSIPSPDAQGLVDLSPDVVASLERDGIHTYPSSAWKPGGVSGGMNMRFSIGLPIRRPDGDYDVSYGYYCGDLCAGWYTAVMRRDEAGWHVVSTVMNAIS